MARRQKAPDALPSKAYLVSFGDTMTTLLAFFIVLCSLAEDQTGANLHTGTGSFIKALEGGGLPGALSGDKSERAVQLAATSPLYMAAKPDDLPADRDGAGPDQDPNEIPSKDREQEEFMRFLNEMERFVPVESEPDTTGETTFDFFEPLNPQPPYLPANYGEITARIVPLLRRDSHRIEVIVWATTPSRTARTRAALQAGRIVAELLRQAGTTDQENKRILGLEKPWPYKEVKRPVISIVIRRVNTNGRG